MQWDWNVIINSMPKLLEGLIITVELMTISVLLGLFLV